MGLLDCKSVIITVLSAIVAFYAIRDYNAQKVDLFRLGHASSLSPLKANELLVQHSKIWNGCGLATATLIMRRLSGVSSGTDGQTRR